MVFFSPVHSYARIPDSIQMWILTQNLYLLEQKIGLIILKKNLTEKCNFRSLNFKMYSLNVGYSGTYL